MVGCWYVLLVRCRALHFQFVEYRVWPVGVQATGHYGSKAASQKFSSRGAAFGQKKPVQVDETLIGKYVFIELVDWHKFSSSESL